MTSRLTLLEHQPCGWRWWTWGDLPLFDACPSCGEPFPLLTVHYPNVEGGERAASQRHLTPVPEPPSDLLFYSRLKRRRERRR